MKVLYVEKKISDKRMGKLGNTKVVNISDDNPCIIVFIHINSHKQ